MYQLFYKDAFKAPAKMDPIIKEIKHYSERVLKNMNTGVITFYRFLFYESSYKILFGNVLIKYYYKNP